MPVKKTKKMERKLVAFEDKDHQESRSIASYYKIPIAIVRAAMYEAGHNGKPARSRKNIYAKLTSKGYDMTQKAKVKQVPVEQPN